MRAEELWCIHIEGPDDIVAMPHRLLAERDARLMNDNWRNRANPSENDPLFRAVAKPWPYSPEQHAEDMARSRQLEKNP